MLIKYTSQASFTASNGVTFNQYDEKEIDDKVGKTLIDTFIGMFEDITPKAQPTVKADKPKTEIKPKAQAE